MQPTIPQEFLDYARLLLGRERASCLEAALKEPASVSIRLNPLKRHRAGLDIRQEAIYDADVPWSETGVYLKERPSFTADPLFHAGTYYVQEASSMFLEQAVKQYVHAPVRALDLCAAPGGKSTHLRALLPEGSLLVSNEPVRARAVVLAENMAKWGHPDVVVTQSYPKDFAALEACFDLLLTDVPCSGEGMFRKEEDAVTGWSHEAVRLCRDRQREILSDVWPALKPGGLLIYSTCTLNQYEDEENVAWIARELGADVLPLCPEESWGVAGNLLASSDMQSEEGAKDVSAYHFVQGLTRGEGFFLSVLRKHTDGNGEPDWAEDVPSRAKAKKKGGGKEPLFPDNCKRWLASPDDFCFLSVGDEWRAVRKHFMHFVGCLGETVKVLAAGVTVAVLKGRDWIPSHALSMSVLLRPDAFCSVPLAYAEAVAYLRKESLVLPADTPRGYVLLTFGGVPIGFAKNVGNRANNLYPQEWKIRSAHLSDFCLGTQNMEIAERYKDIKIS